MTTVQATSFFYLLFLFVAARSQRIFTVDQSDLNAVTFTDGWTTVPHSPAIGTSFAFTSKPGARVSIALPQGAVAARYVGFQRETSTTYSFCVDCFTAGANDNLRNVTSVQVDATSLNANERASSLSLFTVDNLDPTAPHVITVFNPKPQNVITFDAVIAELLNNTGTPSTLPPAPPTPVVVTSTSTPFPISSVAPPDPLPTPPSLASYVPASIGYSSATSTLPPPSTTSQGSSSGGINKRVSLPLITALTVAFTVILVAILLVHLHIRRPRRDDPILGSDDKRPIDPDPHGLSTTVVQDHSDSTESGVLPTPVVWSPTSPKTSTSRPRSAGARAHLDSRHVRTPSMMETLQSQTDSSESVPNNDIGGHPQLPKDVA